MKFSRLKHPSIFSARGFLGTQGCTLYRKGKRRLLGLCVLEGGWVEVAYFNILIAHVFL